MLLALKRKCFRMTQGEVYVFLLGKSFSSSSKSASD